MNQSTTPTLTDEETRELANIQKIKTFNKGDILIRENDIIKQYYFVINVEIQCQSLSNIFVLIFFEIVLLVIRLIFALYLMREKVLGNSLWKISFDVLIVGF